jgi:hypothetical protein
MPVVLLIGVYGALLTACSGDFPALIRRHTYPPNFKYIERGQVSSAMWQLAQASTILDQVMRQPGAVDPARRAEVVRLLTSMLAATSILETQDRPTNHPLISEHLEQFERDLIQARRGVESEPPSYYLVGTVSGACLTCHSP